MVLYEQVQEQEEKQAGAELCQAQQKLVLSENWEYIASWILHTE